MVDANVKEFPIWNKRSTATQRFSELARMAEADPSQFNHVIIVWSSPFDEKEVRVDYTGVNLNTPEMLGLVELLRLRICTAVTDNE